MLMRSIEQAVEQADNIRAIIAKKTIRAPFSGVLGIRLVNLGQILSAGDAIVSLQSLDPIFVNFSLPQQQLSRIRTGLTVRVESDAQPGQAVEGTITAINPEVETATRNIKIQATLKNTQHLLRPGMSATATVVLPEQDDVLAIPVTAVLNAPYSDSVFIVEDDKNDKKHRRRAHIWHWRQHIMALQHRPAPLMVAEHEPDILARTDKWLPAGIVCCP